jgi:ATP-dependent Lon protease
MEIAKRFLVRKQKEATGLTDEQIAFEDSGINGLIQYYTREAGVRNLEREIGGICRKVARRFAEHHTASVHVTLPSAPTLSAIVSDGSPAPPATSSTVCPSLMPASLIKASVKGANIVRMVPRCFVQNGAVVRHSWRVLLS